MQNRKDCYKSISFVDSLKVYLHKSTKVTQATWENTLASLNRLSLNEDDLTLLIIENCILDIILHKQKIYLMDFSECSIASECCAGKFFLATRLITLVKLPNQNDFSNVIIHEFAHAVTGFAFRSDPLPFASQFGDLFPNALNHFLSGPLLPYPAERITAKYKKFNLHPSALKFQQCVREDYKYNQENNFAPTGIDIFDNFFVNLERKYPDGILEEILPVYMECRIELFCLAKENYITNDVVLNTLANRLPRIHDYFETDLKKVLKCRLMSFSSVLYAKGLESQYIKQYVQVKIRSHEITPSFKKDGTLYFNKHLF